MHSARKTPNAGRQPGVGNTILTCELMNIVLLVHAQGNRPSQSPSDGCSVLVVSSDNPLALCNSLVLTGGPDGDDRPALTSLIQLKSADSSGSVQSGRQSPVRLTTVNDAG